MLDVDNFLCGEEGVIVVFGLQKGVQFVQVVLLDGVLVYFVGVLEQVFGCYVVVQFGVGVVGGFGYVLLMLGV